MSIVQKLTEGIVNRDLAQEGSALINKWEQTGLLEGLTDDTKRNGMARLLENQAKELLRESSSMSGGDVEGFAAVAFPLVRRVFGSLIASDLVSVQPMSLPSGLIFFLDFTTSTLIGDGVAADDPRLGYPTGSSLYGGGVVGSQITGGVDLSGQFAEEGPYALNNGYSSPTGSVAALTVDLVASGTVGDGGIFVADAGFDAGYGGQEMLQFDPDLVSGSSAAIAQIPVAELNADQFNFDDYVAITLSGLTPSDLQVRRLSRKDPLDNTEILVTCVGTGSATDVAALLNGVTSCTMPIVDNFDDGGALGSVEGAIEWGLEANTDIPEIDIKVDSVAVTAVTKKLKAKWTPELGQDLNAYHNLDAEVELTQILSEQIALEIDREILEDLVRDSAAGVRFWSRNPGEFLNRETGTISNLGEFTGNVSEWYETLIETINDVSAQIHRKTLRGAANFIVC